MATTLNEDTTPVAVVTENSGLEDPKASTVSESQIYDKNSQLEHFNIESDDDDEPTQSNEELLVWAKEQLQKNRKIIITNLPKEATEEDVHAFMKSYVVTDIEVDNATAQAVVTVINGWEVDQIVAKLDKRTLLGTEVTVVAHPYSLLVCVAHLPLNMTDGKFRKLMSMYGPVKRCFLMRSEDTGKSKGYGIVEFDLELDTLLQVRGLLDWNVINGCKLHCDFLDENFKTYDKLHSRCLLIDNLPDSFQNASNLREIFSRNTCPVYCQIVTKDSEPLGYGIIEYTNPADAEKAMESVKGEKILDTEIRISYCLPGKSAVFIFNRIMSKHEELQSDGKPAQVPEPVYPNPSLSSLPLVEALTTEFPDLMQSFQQALQHVQKSYFQQMTSIQCNKKPGILGAAPSISMHPLGNPSMQLGLMVFLVLQTRGKKELTGPLQVLNTLGQLTNNTQGMKPSLLGDPVTAQAGILLQNLQQQLRPALSMPRSLLQTQSSKPVPLLSLVNRDPTDMATVLENVCKLNISWLANFGQIVNTLYQQYQKSGSSSQTDQTPPNLLSLPPLKPAGLNLGGGGLLPVPEGAETYGPNMNVVAAANFMKNLQEIAIKKLTGQERDLNLNTLFGSQGISSLYNVMGIENKSAAANSEKSNSGEIPSLLEMSSLSQKFANRKGDGLLPDPEPLSGGSTNQGNTNTGGDGHVGYQGQGYDMYNYYGNKQQDNQQSNYYGYENQGAEYGYGQDYSQGSYPAGYDQNYQQGSTDNSMRNNTQANNNYNNYNYGHQNYDNSFGGGYGQYGERPQQDGGPRQPVPGEPNYQNMMEQAMAYAAASSTPSYNYNYGPPNAGFSNFNAQGYGPNSYGAQEWGQGTGPNNFSAQGSVPNSMNAQYPRPNNYNSQGPGPNTISTQGSGPNTISTQGSGPNTISTQGSGPNTISTQGSGPNTISTQGSGSSNLIAQGSGGQFSGRSSGSNTMPSQDPRVNRYGSIGSRSSAQGSNNMLPPPLPASLLSTPVGQKRSYSHLLPPPEASPEGDYIGQHSQGIGGHYAETYAVKRQRLDSSGRFSLQK